VVRTLLAGPPRQAGQQSIVWDGRGKNGARVAAGRYRVRVAAANELGRVELASSFSVGA
jgi:hypothetical protein